MKKLPEITLDDWTKAIRELNQPDVIPKGWIKSDELAAHLNLSKSRGRDLLLDLRRAGRIEVRRFKVVCRDGRLYPAIHYKLKK